MFYKRLLTRVLRRPKLAWADITECRVVLQTTVDTSVAVAPETLGNFPKVKLLLCFGEKSMTCQACLGAKREMWGPGYVCLFVTGSIFRLEFEKKYDQLNENR